MVRDEASGHGGEQRLAPGPDRRHPSSVVNRVADVALVAELRLTRVEAHPHANDSVLGPGVSGEASLRGRGGGDRFSGATEYGEAPVALRADEQPPVLVEGVAKQLPVRAEQPLVAPMTDLLEQARRPLDAGEQERERASRTL